MMAAQACLPLLEAEAKARQIASGGDKVSDVARAVVPVLAQPVRTLENPEMPPQKNIRASQEAEIKL